jgi:hypothetical protein
LIYCSFIHSANICEVKSSWKGGTGSTGVGQVSRPVQVICEQQSEFGEGARPALWRKNPKSRNSQCYILPMIH